MPIVTGAILILFFTNITDLTDISWWWIAGLVLFRGVWRFYVFKMWQKSNRSPMEKLLDELKKY